VVIGLAERVRMVACGALLLCRLTDFIDCESLRRDAHPEIDAKIAEKLCLREHWCSDTGGQNIEMEIDIRVQMTSKNEFPVWCKGRKRE
jgi:hypothetical protein